MPDLVEKLNQHYKAMYQEKELSLTDPTEEEVNSF
jgi:hypothetical protein